jgi:hypothetical protein
LLLSRTLREEETGNMEEKKFKFNALSTDLKAHIVDKVSSTSGCSETNTE